MKISSKKNKNEEAMRQRVRNEDQSDSEGEKVKQTEEIMVTKNQKN